jgi:type IX secretion system PorP/SprF family membrane protein
MKKILFGIISGCLFQLNVVAQGIHFSQYYNAPLLLNPANTGMLSENDWRVGIQYRNQGATIPIPYNTFSGFADLGIGRSKWEKSWLGAGIAFWRDAAGDGKLALTKIQANLAYHILMSDKTTFSAGLAISQNQRSVDISKLTFDAQWDEFAFDKNAPNLEGKIGKKTSFTDVSAGISIAHYNNNNFYLKTSLGFNHVNQPIETFYGQTNKLGLRPNLHVDVIYKASQRIMINPSAYFTMQKRASELITGSLFNINATQDGPSLMTNEIILGAFYRNGDAIIAVAGFKFKNHRFMVNYDHTISSLNTGNKGLGALEFSILFQGNYRNDDERKVYGCPRF